MPKPLGTLLNHIAKVAGVKADNADLIAILANPELSKINIPDDISLLLENNLMSEDSAKSKLHGTLKAEMFNGLDAEILRLMTGELNLDSNIVNELSGERNTGKRIQMLVGKVKELNAKPSKSNDAEKEVLIKEINDLKLSDANSKTAHQAEMTALKEAHQGELTNFLIRQQLTGIKMPKQYQELDPELRLSLLEKALQKDLSDKGVKIINDNGRLKPVSADGTDYFENNLKVDFKALVEGSASRNKLIATADDDAPMGGAGGGNPVIPGGNVLNAGDANFLSQLTAQANAYTKV